MAPNVRFYLLRLKVTEHNFPNCPFEKYINVFLQHHKSNKFEVSPNVFFFCYASDLVFASINILENAQIFRTSPLWKVYTFIWAVSVLSLDLVAPNIRIYLLSLRIRFGLKENFSKRHRIFNSPNIPPWEYKVSCKLQVAPNIRIYLLHFWIKFRISDHFWKRSRFFPVFIPLKTTESCSAISGFCYFKWRRFAMLRFIPQRVLREGYEGYTFY